MFTETLNELIVAIHSFPVIACISFEQPKEVVLSHSAVFNVSMFRLGVLFQNFGQVVAILSCVSWVANAVLVELNDCLCDHIRRHVVEVQSIIDRFLHVLPSHQLCASVFVHKV